MWFLVFPNMATPLQQKWNDTCHLICSSSVTQSNPLHIILVLKCCDIIESYKPTKLKFIFIIIQVEFAHPPFMMHMDDDQWTDLIEWIAYIQYMLSLDLAYNQKLPKPVAIRGCLYIQQKEHENMANRWKWEKGQHGTSSNIYDWLCTFLFVGFDHQPREFVCVFGLLIGLHFRCVHLFCVQQNEKKN